MKVLGGVCLLMFAGLMFGLVSPLRVTPALAVEAENLGIFDEIPNEADIKNADPTTGTDKSVIDSVVNRTIDILLYVGGVVSFIYIILGGWQYIVTGGGDQTKIDTARQTIITAVVGLIIIVAATLILNTSRNLITNNDDNTALQTNL